MSAVLDRPSTPAPAFTHALPELPPGVSPALKPQLALKFARDLAEQRADWALLFREVLGVDGIARKLFPTPDEYSAFLASPAYAEITSLLAKRRELDKRYSDGEATRVITVRLPASLHVALKEEAYARQTNLNQLCISKLLQVLEAGESEVGGQ